ncbi:MAG TPA: SDR family oxidoreductase [Acidimicrobiales bacterium]|nr:SDR family oxidoreductase [Acidimicrobiales bacterium]
MSERTTDTTERNLADQVAVITGGGRGLGRAIALAWAERGARVLCSARSRAELEDTAAAITSRGGEAEILPADVASEQDMQRLMAHAVERFGRLDVVLLNAGVNGGRLPIEQLPMEDWRQCLDINLTGVFLGIKAAVPHLRAAGGGKIIGMGSGSSLHSPAEHAGYSASKAGLTALLRSAARELRPDHIAVNELHPGPTATAMHGVTTSDPTESDIVDHPRRRQEGGEWFKAPQVVAELACFLAGLPNDGVTGQLFSLNSLR